VGADGSWVVFSSAEERCFPLKNKAESSQLNDESSKQKKLPENTIL
tara:strand:- start:546 stop:683 length:138 start_codon:yes stop_codon:yes gene_type:complete